MNRTALLLAASALSFAPSILAQPAHQPANRPAANEPVGVPLADAPFRLDSVGLGMQLPEGAVAQTTRVGDQLGVQITPPPPDSTWVINLQTPVSQNQQLTAAKVAEEVLNQLLGTVGVVNRSVQDGRVSEKLVSTGGSVISPVKAYEVASADPDARREAAHFYVRLPRGEKDPAVIRGYTIFKVAPGKFVTFDLATTEPQFEAARRIYEVVLGTVRFTDPGMIAATRGAAVESGIDLLSRLSPTDYENALAALKDQYYRRYKPAPGGSDNDATEIAYRRVRAWKGMRGEIDPKANPASLRGSERQLGYLVRIDARHLQGDRIVDSVGVYFMTSDRREEAWNLQMVVRDPTQRTPGVWREAGARDGQSMNVTVSGTGQEDQIWRPIVPEAGYITMVESFLLPHLTIGSKSSPGERGFYGYNSAQNKVVLRRDILAEVADRAGAWKLIVKSSEDDEPHTGIYNERGDIIQLSFSDGSVLTPTTLPRLVDLWRQKSLPLE